MAKKEYKDEANESKKRVEMPGKRKEEFKKKK